MSQPEISAVPLATAGEPLMRSPAFCVQICFPVLALRQKMSALSVPKTIWRGPCRKSWPRNGFASCGEGPEFLAGVGGDRVKKAAKIAEQNPAVEHQRRGFKTVFALIESIFVFRL